STGGARLNRNQARSSTDCSHPRRRDGLINWRLPRRFKVALRWQAVPGKLLMAHSAGLMLAPTRGRSRSAVRHRGLEQPRIKVPRQGIGCYGAVESLPATLPVGSECVLTANKRPVGTLCPNWPFVCRGDWIRTSDLLNPILWVKAAPSRRI